MVMSLPRAHDIAKAMKIYPELCGDTQKQKLNASAITDWTRKASMVGIRNKICDPRRVLNLTKRTWKKLREFGGYPFEDNTEPSLLAITRRCRDYDMESLVDSKVARVRRNESSV